MEIKNFNQFINEEVDDFSPMDKLKSLILSAVETEHFNHENLKLVSALTSEYTREQKNELLNYYLDNLFYKFINYCLADNEITKDLFIIKNIYTRVIVETKPNFDINLFWKDDYLEIDSHTPDVYIKIIFEYTANDEVSMDNLYEFENPFAGVRINLVFKIDELNINNQYRSDIKIDADEYRKTYRIKAEIYDIFSDAVMNGEVMAKLAEVIDETFFAEDY